MPFVMMDQLADVRVEWLWQGRLAPGHLAILDGDPGLGKSLVTVDLCARITTGRPFPDGQAGGEPASVVVINAEDGARDVLQSRLRAAGADLARVSAYDHTPGEAFLRLPGHLDRLDAVVESSGARYVVLDPIMAFLDQSVNVASDQSVRAALSPLAQLAVQRRCAIQMVRHLSKGGGTNPLYRGLYSIGFIASCRVAWLLARDPKVVNQYVIAQAKNNLDPPQTSLAYAIESAECGTARIAWRGTSPFNDTQLLAGTPSRLRLRFQAQEFLLAFLKDGPRSTREIWAAAQERNIARRTLDRARTSLEIETTRVKVGTPQQMNYWVLPNHEITSAICDLPELVTQLRRQHQACQPSTPLDQTEKN